MPARKESEYAVVAYTDGGCQRNPGGPGGIGIVIIDNRTGEYIEHSEGFESTTNNRMEITAIMRAVELVGDANPILIKSDSQYTINIAKGLWKPKQNMDLWAQYRKLTRNKNIDYEWVRGHAGNVHNERCDELATEAMKNRKTPKKKDTTNQGQATTVQLDDIPEYLNRKPDLNRNNFFSYAVAHGIQPYCASTIANFLKKEHPTFDDYATLKTNGKDKYSTMGRDVLLQYAEHADEAFEIIKLYFQDNARAMSCLRWFARGLPLKDCIRHELVSMEISNKIQEASRR